MSGFTAGPWHADTSTPNPSRFIRDADGRIIVYCDGPLAEAKANQRLIVEAPALVAACKALAELASDHLDVMGYALEPKVLRDAYAILARVRGQ